MTKRPKDAVGRNRARRMRRETTAWAWLDPVVVDLIDEALTVIRTEYTPEQQAQAADFIVSLEGERAALCGALGLTRQEA